MPAEIRRTLLNVQTTHIEGGKGVPVPTKLVAALAIIRNPWFGRGWVADLTPKIRVLCPELGKLLTGMILKVTGDNLEGFGKASVVGMGGEIEHAQALTHSVWFGNQFREPVNAKSYLAFTNTRGVAGTSLMIPLMDKDDGGRRSHYQTIHLTAPDVPVMDVVTVPDVPRTDVVAPMDVVTAPDVPRADVVDAAVDAGPPPSPRVTLRNASASFSQPTYTVDEAINGVVPALSVNDGWAVSNNGATAAQSAVFEFAEDSPGYSNGTELTVTLPQLAELLQVRGRSRVAVVMMMRRTLLRVLPRPRA
jgi:hypothetical protein